jgi:uncharacterized protein (DUF2267 family)
MQDYSGFSDGESADALELLVENVSAHLTEGERRDFASQLPEELQELAMAPTGQALRDNILEQFMELEDIEENQAKKQIKAAWRAIKDAISHGEAEDIKAQLPGDMVALLQ